MDKDMKPHGSLTTEIRSDSEEKKDCPQMDELEQAVRPLVDLIRKKYTPMTTVIVTGVYAEILSTEVGVAVKID